MNVEIVPVKLIIMLVVIRCSCMFRNHNGSSAIMYIYFLYYSFIIFFYIS